MTPTPSADADVPGVRLERVHRVERARRARRGGRRARPRSAPAASSPGFGMPAAAARLEPPLRLAQLVLERARSAPASAVDRLRAGGRGGALERVERARGRGRPRAAPVSGLDAAHPGADAPLAGDDEAADLAGRAAVRAAAQLEAVVLDADRPDRLAVLLVEERVGAALDRLGHRHERDGDRPVLADDARTSSSIARFSSSVRARSNGKSKRR